MDTFLKSDLGVSPELFDILTRFQSLAYILAALLFILALAGLSKQRTAQRGNVFGIVGMAIALVATVMISAFQYQETAIFTIVLSNSLDNG